MSRWRIRGRRGRPSTASAHQTDVARYRSALGIYHHYSPLTCARCPGSRGQSPVRLTPANSPMLCRRPRLLQTRLASPSTCMARSRSVDAILDAGQRPRGRRRLQSPSKIRAGSVEAVDGQPDAKDEAGSEWDDSPPTLKPFRSPPAVLLSAPSVDRQQSQPDVDPVPPASRSTSSSSDAPRSWPPSPSPSPPPSKGAQHTPSIGARKGRRSDASCQSSKLSGEKQPASPKAGGGGRADLSRQNRLRKSNVVERAFTKVRSAITKENK